MPLIWIDEGDERLNEDRRMDAKKIKDTRRRLSSEYENLIKSINRNRLTAEQITVESTEDEGDLATNQPRQRTFL